MTKRPRKALLLLVALIMALALPGATVVAQDGGTIIAEGFNAPQGILVDPDGNVWVIDSGVGGDTDFEMIDPVTGETSAGTYGETARVVKIEPDGTQTDVAMLPSVFAGDEATGGGALAMIDGELYATSGVWIGDGTDNAAPTIPNMAAVVKIGEDGTVEQIAPTWRLEKRMNPDNSVYESHPYGLAVDPNGELWVADAGANTLLRVDPASSVIELITTFPPIPGVFPAPARGGEMLADPVPTGIAFDDDGNAYVSLLSGAPFVPGSASVIKVTPAGARSDFATNLTMLTDIRRGPDDAFYVVQFAIFTDQGPTPDSGAIIKLAEDGSAETVVDGLSFPTALGFDADGNAYVTINGSGAPGSGAVAMYEGVGTGETYLASAAMAEVTEEPTEEPTEEATEEATEEPTEEPTEEATEEPTEEPTEEATEEPTEEPTATATVEPTATATKEPTATATVEPTATATKEPTATATVEPTATATEEPTATATVEPTAEATEEATAETAMAEMAMVQADDQVSDGTQVTVANVVAAQDGWMVIHADADGRPGSVLGKTAVAAGTTENVIVILDEPVDPDTPLWAMLHVDEGVQGVYEFPGADIPVEDDGAIVMVPFTALGEIEPTEEAMTEPTEEATTEPTEEATTEPTEEAVTEPTEEATTEPTATDAWVGTTPEATAGEPAAAGEKGAPASLPNTGAALPSLPSVLAVVMAVLATLVGGVSIRRRK